MRAVALHMGVPMSVVEHRAARPRPSPPVCSLFPEEPLKSRSHRHDYITRQLEEFDSLAQVSQIRSVHVLIIV